MRRLINRIDWPAVAGLACLLMVGPLAMVFGPGASAAMETDMHARTEDTDIVRFVRDEDEPETGWVNVGAFAIRIGYDGHQLQVEAFALGNEDKALASMTVAQSEAIAAGAENVDPFNPESGHEGADR